MTTHFTAMPEALTAMPNHFAAMPTPFAAMPNHLASGCMGRDLRFQY
jgi:hypothetical protein